MTFQAALSVLTVLDEEVDQIQLADTYHSLRTQTMSRWEWVVAAPGKVQVLTDLMAVDPKIRLLTPADLEQATQSAAGSYLTYVAAGDQLDRNLVAKVAALGVARPSQSAMCFGEADTWAYTDEIAPHPTLPGKALWHKPGWSPEFLRSQPYAVCGAILPRALVAEVGGIDLRAGSAAWYDLVLKVAERSPKPAVHLSQVYYRHRRAQDGPPPWQPCAPADGLRALAAHLDRTGIGYEEVTVVSDGDRYLGHRIHRTLPSYPRVSIVIPTRGDSSLIYGLPRCHVVELVRSLWTPQRYPNLEIVVVYDDGTDEAVLAELRSITDDEVVLDRFVGPFHFARKCNQGALTASGDLVLFLNDDMEVVTADWLHQMVALLDADDVGAVGAKLLFADGTIQHIGHLYIGAPGHVLFREAADTTAEAGVALLAGERCGVTGACLLMRTADFADLGGFSDQFPANYNDVDLCLKIRAAGQRIVCTPSAVLYHYESQTRDPTVNDNERVLLERRWGEALYTDPLLNPCQHPPRPRRHLGI